MNENIGVVIFLRMIKLTSCYCMDTFSIYLFVFVCMLIECMIFVRILVVHSQYQDNILCEVYTILIILSNFGLLVVFT